MHVRIYIYLKGGGRDFSIGSFDITFPAGETIALYNVSINNDNIIEHNETFTISIVPSSLPNGVTVATPNQTTVTIIDDDSK